MGDQQSTVEETDGAPASPRSPTSPRVVPVDHGETSNEAQLQLDASRGDETPTSINSSAVMVHEDNDDAAPPLDDEPGPAASQRYDDEEKRDLDPTASDGIVTIKHVRLKRMITDALDDTKRDKADDPNRLNYTINAVEAIVENRSQRTEQNLRSELAAMEKKIDKLTDMIQKLLDEKEQS